MQRLQTPCYALVSWCTHLLHLIIRVLLLGRDRGIRSALLNTTKQFSTHPPHPTAMYEDYIWSASLFSIYLAAPVLAVEHRMSSLPWGMGDL